MRALAAANDRAAAMRHARAFQRLLRVELEMDPNPEVDVLAEQMRRAPLATSPAAAAPVLVVLPFENTSGDPQDDPFSDGLARPSCPGQTRRELLLRHRQQVDRKKRDTQRCRTVAF